MSAQRSAAIAAAICTAAAIAHPVNAGAATSTVSPGDEIEHIEIDGGSHVCTLGYTYTADTGATYGVTAGHCNAAPGRYVIDRTTGATGRFVVTRAERDEPLADDFGLIDFGANRSTPLMNGMLVTGIAQPQPGQAICHTGIRTGVACGQLGERLIGYQYTTTGMPASIPGDSGGPVWQLSRGETAIIVGIWLGEHITADGVSYGRFTTLPDAIANLAIDGLRD